MDLLNNNWCYRGANFLDQNWVRISPDIEDLVII